MTVFGGVVLSPIPSNNSVAEPIQYLRLWANGITFRRKWWLAVIIGSPFGLFVPSSSATIFSPFVIFITSSHFYLAQNFMQSSCLCHIGTAAHPYLFLSENFTPKLLRSYHCKVVSFRVAGIQL